MRKNEHHSQSLILLFFCDWLLVMIGKSVIHGVRHPGPELKLRVHLRPALRGNGIINLGAILLPKILPLSVLQRLPRINRILFTQLKPTPTAIVNTVICILRVIVGHVFGVDSDFWQVAVSVDFL